MPETFTVLGIVGSLKKTSFNWKLMRRAKAVATEGITFDVFAYLGVLPYFSEDREGERTPRMIQDFRQRIESCDAILVATPEYNGSMPGVLKNALDWASRPPGESVLDGKPAAVMGASPGRYGAARSQADVRKVLTAIGAEVLDRELSFPRVHEMFDDQDKLLDLETGPRLAGHLAALIELAGGATPAEESELAEYSRTCQQLASDQRVAEAA
ncbi:MAG: NAD(P)H-dependent oxidoreductase [Solirubrobacterales bacterium]|nr:NAD(P)H-dependent oxidoreductase [Solirubrobacterales bacterium]